MTDNASGSALETMIQVKSILLKFDKYDDIRANHPSSPDKPEALPGNGGADGFTPDITARKGDRFTIFKVNTAESINDSQTGETWAQYAQYANDNDAVFIAVVPKGNACAAKSRLEELNIEAAVEEVIES